MKTVIGSQQSSREKAPRHLSEILAGIRSSPPPQSIQAAAQRPKKAHCHRCNDNGWLTMVDNNGYQIYLDGKPKLIRCLCMRPEDEERRAKQLLEIDGLLDNEREIRFENIEIGNANDPNNPYRLIYEAVHHSQSPRGFFVMSGTPGSGKTTLMIAAINEARNKKYASLYVVLKQVLDHLREAYKPGSVISYDGRWELLTNGATVLAIDEFGFDNERPWTMAQLEDLVDSRWRQRHEKMTMFATNLTRDNIATMSEKIASRLFGEATIKLNLGKVDLRKYVK